MHNKSLIICFFSLVIFQSYSQQIYVIKVSDKDTRLALSGVKIKKDSTITTTNVAGYFQLEAKAGDELTAFLDGYEPIFLKLPEQSRLTFSLKPIQTKKQSLLVKSFYEYLGKNINYPREARMNGIHGLTQIYFEVDTLNRIAKIEALNNLGGGCTEEIINLVENAPQVWFDATGKRQFLLPVRFRLGSSKMKDMPDVTPGIVVLPEFVVSAHAR